MSANEQTARRHIEIRHYLAGQQVTADEFAQVFAAEVRAGWERALGVTLPEVERMNRRVDCHKSAPKRAK